MAWDEGLAQILRDALIGQAVTEKKMFGGLAFLIGGHMVCGVHRGGAMMRVGKAQYDAALALPGVAPMMFPGRPMAGMVDVADEAVADPARLEALMRYALTTVLALPPKPAPAPRRAMAKREKG